MKKIMLSLYAFKIPASKHQCQNSQGAENPKRQLLSHYILIKSHFNV